MLKPKVVVPSLLLLSIFLNLLFLVFLMERKVVVIRPKTLENNSKFGQNIGISSDAALFLFNFTENYKNNKTLYWTFQEESASVKYTVWFTK